MPLINNLKTAPKLTLGFGFIILRRRPCDWRTKTQNQQDSATRKLENSK